MNQVLFTLVLKLIPGDILVGKVTPKGETQLTPEEKLLRAIFGEKASDVKDTFFACANSGEGTVIDVQVFTRDGGVEKDERALTLKSKQIATYRKDRCKMSAYSRSSIYDRLKLIGLLLKNCQKGCKVLKKGDKVNESSLRLNWKRRFNGSELREAMMTMSTTVRSNYRKQQLEAELRAEQDRSKFEDKREQDYNQGDDLAPGVLKIVKVYVAVKRKLQPGDKMAGRHGNKGVISRIMPVEDMPHDEDGDAS